VSEVVVVLPWGAGDDDVVAAAQHHVVQQRGQRDEWQRAGVEQPLDLGVAAGLGVADDDEIGRLRAEFFGVVSLTIGDAGGGEHVAHRRIDAGVGTDDLMSGRARQKRGVAHGGAGDAHEINLHRGGQRGRAAGRMSSHPRTGKDTHAALPETRFA
jgi:hypothetical protein